MMNERQVRDALLLWHQHSSEEQLPGEGHLDDEVLYQLALPGGLQQADDGRVEHLSTCAVCMEKWVSWMETAAIAGDVSDEDAEVVCSVGFLKAAASSIFQGPLTLDSACGRFELAVYPDLDNPGQAMVVLEAKRESPEYEGRYCVVRDGRGVTLLSGLIEDGRCAGRVTDLQALDLKTWTVTVSRR